MGEKLSSLPMAFGRSLRLWLLVPALLEAAGICALAFLPPRSLWRLALSALFLLCGVVEIAGVSFAISHLQTAPASRTWINMLCVVAGVFAACPLLLLLCVTYLARLGH